MPTYSTTIQLHNADERDFTVLDKELKKDSFTSDKNDVLNYVNNALDNFVNVKYIKHGNLLIQEVIDSVLNAAKKTGKKFSFTVVKKRA